MKIFATALSAVYRETEDTISISVLPGITMAESEAEARVTAKEQVLELFPESGHWEGHTISLVEIEENVSFGPHRLVWHVEDMSKVARSEIRQEGENNEETANSFQ